VTRPIRTARPASEELTAAVRWYEEQRSGLGAEFFDAVLETLARIAEHPEAGAVAFGAIEARRMLVAGFPYHVVYRRGVEDIRVLAFAHLKRRPGFWMHRR